MTRSNNRTVVGSPLHARVDENPEETHAAVRVVAASDHRGPGADVVRLLNGVTAFADDMRAQGIHVGMGRIPRCVTCGELWPCEGSKP